MAKFNGERLTKYRQDEVGSAGSLDGVKLSTLVDQLKALQKKHGPDAVFNVEVDSDYGPCSGYTSVNMNVSSNYLETPLEYAERHKQWQAVEKHKRDLVKERRKAREAQDRKEFERLSKKYGK